MAALLLWVGGVCLEAAAADRYVTENGIEYRVTEGSPSYLNFAYIVRIDGTNSHVVIPERFTVGGKDCLVKGFDKGAKLTAWFNLFYLTLPDGFEFNEVDLSDFSVDIFTWANKLGPVDKKSKFASYSHYISSIKVFYTSYDSNTLKNAKTWQDMGFACVAPLSLVNGDDGDGYYYSSAFDGGAAVVSELTGSAESITIPKIKKDYSGNSHQVKYFGLPDARITNYAAESLTFEGPITLLGGLDNLTSLKKVSFAGIDDYDDICSLKGKLIRNQNLEEIYFTGNTLPNLRGAANAYSLGLRKVCYVVSLSVSHNKANINRTHEQSLDAFKEIRAAYPDLNVVLDLATTFGCPFEGKYEDPAAVVAFLRDYVDAGIKEVCLCDTIGIADPVQVRRVIGAVKEAYPDLSLSVHFHDTRGLGMVNTLAAIEAGVDEIQSALGGLGGCPFAPGASGNLATEDAIWMLNEMGYETGVSFSRILAAAKHEKELIEGNYSGHHINIADETPCKA